MMVAADNDHTRLAALRFLKQILCHCSFLADLMMENGTDAVLPECLLRSLPSEQPLEFRGWVILERWMEN
jgi:hypothetical protein